MDATLLIASAPREGRTCESSQAQYQLNAQAQAQSQAAVQLNQTHTTAPQAQGAIAAERERQKDFQVEKETGEHASSSKATGYLATSGSQTVPQGAAALAWAGSICALAAGLFYKQRTQNKDKRTRPAYIKEEPPEGLSRHIRGQENSNIGRSDACSLRG